MPVLYWTVYGGGACGCVGQMAGCEEDTGGGFGLMMVYLGNEGSPVRHEWMREHGVGNMLLANNYRPPKYLSETEYFP